MTWLYTDKVKEHFINPKNFLVDEADFQYDSKGIVGNVQCGDQIEFFIKVDKEKQIIADCRWKTYGCASAIASTSMLSEMVIGMPLDDAYAISPQDIIGQLGGLPEHKIHCSVLGDKALRAAIDDYYAKSNLQHKIKKAQAKLVCQCMNVTDKEIKQAIKNGAKTYADIQAMTKAGTVCGQCADDIKSFL